MIKFVSVFFYFSVCVSRNLQWHSRYDDEYVRQGTARHRGVCRHLL